MDPHELNRMFDRLAPTAEQEQEGLNRLLRTERKVVPMKKLKKFAAAGLAAVLMITACAASVAAGIDQRLLDFMGWSAQSQELLAPGAMPVDITMEDNGAALRITQVLRDRYTILMLAEFTAPEGTVLDLAPGGDPFVTFGGGVPELLDGEGAPISAQHSITWNTVVLEDEDPMDHRLSLALTVELMDGIGADVQALSLFNVDLKRFDEETLEMATVYAGDWSCQVPLPQNDTGWSQQDGTVLQLADAAVYEKGIYLSPMALELTLGMDESLPAAEKHRIQRLYLSPGEAVLTDRDGQETLLVAESGSGSTDESVFLFPMPELIDPARFQGGSLSLELGGQTFTIPLDNLVPAE